MPLSRTVTLGTLTVTVHELTVTDVRDALVGEESGAYVDPFHALVFDGFGLNDIARMCDVSAVVLEAVAACQAVNPFFFRMKTAITEAGQRLQLELQANRSPATSAPWWSVATRLFGRIRGVRTS